MSDYKDINCDLVNPCIITSSALDFRVLPRVSAKLYSVPDGAETDKIVEPFLPWYVYGIQSTNSGVEDEPVWYAVGQGRDGYEGWFKREKIVEWRHALLAAYTIPDIRGNVVMFDSVDRLHNLTEQSPSKRSEQLDGITSSVYAGQTPTGVVSLEPDGPENHLAQAIPLQLEFARHKQTK